MTDSQILISHQVTFSWDPYVLRGDIVQWLGEQFLEPDCLELNPSSSINLQCDFA